MACSPDAPGYAELHCLSNFSFLRGASHPAELVARAARLGYRALALTDECSLAGIVRAHVAAREHGLPLLVGSEFRLADGTHLVLLASDRAGYARLSQAITTARRRAPKGRYRLERADLADGAPGCLALLVPDSRTAPDAAWQARLREQAGWLADRFPGRAWLAVQRLHLPGEAARVAALEALAAERDLPLVACGDVHMHVRGRRALQDVLTALRHRRPLAEIPHRLFPNGERHLRPLATLHRLYRPEWLAATLDIAARCRFSLDELRYEYPDEPVPPGRSPRQHLRALVEEGLRHYWPEGPPARVRRQVEHELAVIAELGYEPYFLTVHDIVRFARSRGILCQGRGSAANSAVCYCLHITAVDPARSNLLFERFLSRERGEPPDIDVDFDAGRREEVFQYIYRRYGRERAALAATVITYRRRSALRDAGRALGFTTDQIDRLSRCLVWWQDGLPDERLREAGFDPANPRLRRLLAVSAALTGFPRHLSQHVGGFVIAREPLHRLVPVENAAMPERTVIQWDKHDLQALGLLKVDCLALGMLGALDRCFALLRRHRGLHLSLTRIPANDPATWRMIQRADTVGVFQIESRAQMAMLPRLRPACFYDLVIQIAIVRPGPIQGDMVHPYLRRRRGEEPVDYPGEAVRAVLERTLGVPIFQEQVIELAMVAAGFSGGEADHLRRAIGAWRSTEQLETFHRRLVEGMRARGYPAEFAERIFRQIRGFGEYGFPESHAASFALLAWVSAWLKCHHPAAFACALLNSQPMGFYAPAHLVQDARRHGVEVRPVDVRHSHWDATLEETAGGALAIRLGLRQVKSLGRIAADRLWEARAAAPFRSVPDLLHRADLDRRAAEALAAADALRPLAGHRRQAYWATLGHRPHQPDLFNGLLADDPPPPLPAPAEGQDIVADYAHTGLSLRRHPLALLRPRLRRRGWHSSRRLARTPAGRRLSLIGLVINRQHPGSARGTLFLTLEDEFGTGNIVVHPRTSARHLPAVVHGRLLLVHGRVERDGPVVHLIAHRLHDLSTWLGTLRTPSRDFH